MKKRIIVALLVIIIAVLSFGSMASAVFSPNFATNDHEDMSLWYYGYVQIQSSFCEDEYHAARGYIRYRRYYLNGNVAEDTGRLYTSWGSSASDSTVRSRSTTFRDSIIPNPHKTDFYYGFHWVPDGNSWPL